MIFSFSSDVSVCVSVIGFPLTTAFILLDFETECSILLLMGSYFFSKKAAIMVDSGFASCCSLLVSNLLNNVSLNGIAGANWSESTADGSKG